MEILFQIEHKLVIVHISGLIVICAPQEKSQNMFFKSESQSTNNDKTNN